MLKKLDKAIISLLSQDIPLIQRPFERLAAGLGIKENLLLSRLKSYKKNGLMRKFSAALNHRKIGFRHNAMVVWDIPDNSLEKAAKIMTSLFQVSHCYQRKKSADWDYNLYTMIHGKTKGECLKTVKQIFREVGCCNYRVLFSSKEYKKSAADYR